MYNLDFWVSKKFLAAIPGDILKKNYSDLALMNIFATIRETFFGLLIYLTYLKDIVYTKNITLEIDLLVKLYIQDILHIDPYYHKRIIAIIHDLQADFNEILKHRITIDDNNDYLKIAYDNRYTFGNKKNSQEIGKHITSEDIIRFK